VSTQVLNQCCFHCKKLAQPRQGATAVHIRARFLPLIRLFRIRRGWFILDFLSIFPFDVIAAETGGTQNAARLRIIRIIRLLKLAKLLRIVRANRIFTRWRNLIGLTYSMVQLLQFLVIILVLAHWSACLFFLWSSIFSADFDESWIVA